MKLFIILGKLTGRPQEEIDQFESRTEAEAMLSEYRHAFGPGWILWVEEREYQP
jgi:hypothetical protein